MNILVGDLGGTHTRLALAELNGSQVILTRVERYINSEHANLDAILSRFLDAGNKEADRLCCLAVAGPTDGRSVRFTNLDWRIETTALTERFGFARCQLVNDFAAVGWGLNTLENSALHPLQAGQPQADGARVALGAGTGLGVSLCARRGDHYQPLASEGGHIGFAPCNPEQDRLLVFLRARYGRASNERILSGPGLVDLFRFCLNEAGESDEAMLASANPAQAISAAGLDGTDPIAVRCLRLFAQIYGQTAGDWALAAQTRGGIFLAGGIAPKLLPVLQSNAFLDGFNAKGRYSEWMTRVPVAVILDPDIGLKGAAYAASQSE